MKLVIPRDIRESGDRRANDHDIQGGPQSSTWIIEISSQILFSNSALVHYELAVAREERSLEIGFAAVAGKGYGEPADVQDYIRTEVEGRRRGLPKGVYSRAVHLLVEDTAALWNKPPLPQWRVSYSDTQKLPATTGKSFQRSNGDPVPSPKQGKNDKPRKIHLVILTHGLHSNVGADCLYLKESIDVAAKQARKDAHERKEKSRRGKAEKLKEKHDKSSKPHYNKASSADAEKDVADESDDDDDNNAEDDEVMVRGFNGNAVRTERGIQYLGKRLAKFVLTMTYPDQPFLPESKSMSRTFTGTFSSKSSTAYGASAGSGSHKEYKIGDLPYTFTKISFIGHSLGGLIQTYAIAYIHKHSPEFFSRIKPTNFVCMASPLLGLSNENPMYVKFALDFGLVGRTGQDLGLTWRAPLLARTGWSAMISGLGVGHKDDKPHEDDPRAKPLLRILPTGPAHQVLKMFRNRTVYANVVNDGIVPLRTSCLLFLDWRGLGRVENARRENGLIGTMAAFGWAELTGSNTVSNRPSSTIPRTSSDGHSGASGSETLTETYMTQSGRDVPQPSTDATNEDDERESEGPEDHQFLSDMQHHPDSPIPGVGESQEPAANQTSNPLTDLFNFFRAGTVANSSHSPKPSRKERAYRRAQTIKQENENAANSEDGTTKKRPGAVTRGDSLVVDGSRAKPPPKTSIFEAAGDILHPPIPTQEWLMNPSSRDRTIFHDRVYQPGDIPDPPPKKSFLGRRHSTDDTGMRSGRQSTERGREDSVDGSGMKVEERIARAYHHDLAWRKVLVRLQPDAHNNMIVRRMFANAYGWDVVKHLCDTHFADTAASRTRDEDEIGEDRARGGNEVVGDEGDVVHGQTDGEKVGVASHVKSGRDHRTKSELAEASDELVSLDTPISATGDMSSSIGQPHRNASVASNVSRNNSGAWDDALFEGSVDGDDSDEERSPAARSFEAWHRFFSPNRVEQRQPSARSQQPPALELRIKDSGRAPGTNRASRPQVADVLTQSPSDISSPLVIPQQRSRLTQAAEISSDSSPSVLPATGAEVGLRKSLEAAMGETIAARVMSSGITEDVARAATGHKAGRDAT